MESLEQLDPVAFAELRETAPVGELELPMDLWIDDLAQIHRFLFEIESPDLGDLQPGESFDLMRVQFDFADYGERVTAEPPDPGDVTDINELEHMFGSMFEEFEV